MLLPLDPSQAIASLASKAPTSLACANVAAMTLPTANSGKKTAGSHAAQ